MVAKYLTITSCCISTEFVRYVSTFFDTSVSTATFLTLLPSLHFLLNFYEI